MGLFDHKNHPRGTPYKLPGWQLSLVDKHRRKTGCSCNTVCDHRGWVFSDVYCDTCGKQIG